MQRRLWHLGRRHTVSQLSEGYMFTQSSSEGHNQPVNWDTLVGKLKHSVWIMSICVTLFKNPFISSLLVLVRQKSERFVELGRLDSATDRGITCQLHLNCSNRSCNSNSQLHMERKTKQQKRNETGTQAVRRPLSPETTGPQHESTRNL